MCNKTLLGLLPVNDVYVGLHETTSGCLCLTLCRQLLGASPQTPNGAPRLNPAGGLPSPDPLQKNPAGGHGCLYPIRSLSALHRLPASLTLDDWTPDLRALRQTYLPLTVANYRLTPTACKYRAMYVIKTDPKSSEMRPSIKETFCRL